MVLGALVVGVHQQAVRDLPFLELLVDSGMHLVVMDIMDLTQNSVAIAQPEHIL